MAKQEHQILRGLLPNNSNTKLIQWQEEPDGSIYHYITPIIGWTVVTEVDHSSKTPAPFMQSIYPAAFGFDDHDGDKWAILQADGRVEDWTGSYDNIDLFIREKYQAYFLRRQKQQKKAEVA